MKFEILNGVIQVGITKKMAFEQTLEGGVEEGQVYVGEEHPRGDSQVAGCQECPRSKERVGVFKAEKGKRA